MTRSKDVNQMCLSCKNTSCDGTVSKAQTSCTYEDKNFYLLYTPLTGKIRIVKR